jgi:hypothetical protein
MKDVDADAQTDVAAKVDLVVSVVETVAAYGSYLL